MTTPEAALPDISGFGTVSAASWREFGARLAQIGFGAAYCAAMWQATPDRYPGLHWPIHEWRATRSDESAATVYRLFCLGHELAECAVAAALTRPVLATALDAGLLVRPRAEVLASVLDLRINESLFLLCDRSEHRGEAVFGVGIGNGAFRGIASPSWPAGTAVDIGCGAGAAALVLSRCVGRVVATDIVDRAIAVARVNAHLNAVTNIEFRSGDLFEPVSGETFDLVVSQPPFVPRPAAQAHTIHQFGGARGTDVLCRLFAELPGHLAPGGRAVIVYEAARSADGTDHDPWCSLAPRAGWLSLRLLGSPVHPDVYSIRHALRWLRTGTARFDTAASGMRSHLEDQGLAAIYPAVAVLERRPGEPGWSETVEVEGSLWDAIAPMSIWRLLRGINAIHRGPDAVLDAPVRIPAGTLLIEPADPADGTVYLALPPGYLGQRAAWSREDIDRLRGAGTGQAPGGQRDIDVRIRALRAGLWTGSWADR